MKYCKRPPRKWLIGNTINKLINNLAEKLIVSTHIKKKQSPLVADTSATAHLLQNPNIKQNFIHTSIPITALTPTTTGIYVLLPNKEMMQSTHTTMLDTPHLPEAVRKDHIFQR